jgi:Arc/MetJ family transcription regulator
MAYWVMHRTTLMLDDRKLAKARRLLRTKGIKDTIEAALDEVIAYEARRQAVDQLRNLEGLDLDDPKVMARAWR